MDMSCAAWTDDSEGGHGRIACVMGETQLGHEACIACPNELMARQNGKCDEGTAGAQNVWGDKGMDKTRVQAEKQGHMDVDA